MMEFVVIVLAFGMLGHFYWTSRCCRKANEAWEAARRLYDWVMVVHGPLDCAVQATQCEPGAAEDWPPPPVGSFPPPTA